MQVLVKYNNLEFKLDGSDTYFCCEGFTSIDKAYVVQLTQLNTGKWQLSIRLMSAGQAPKKVTLLNNSGGLDGVYKPTSTYMKAGMTERAHVSIT